MARVPRKDVDYFPHECIHGRKMSIIESKYGNDGYAVWFKLLEQLGKANNHYLDISDEMNFMYLVSIFKVSDEVLKSILNDLAKLDAISTELYFNHNVIFSQKFVDSIADVYRLRKSLAPNSTVVLNEILQKRCQSTVEIPQGDEFLTESIHKEKKSKVKERKEKKSSLSLEGDFEVEEIENYELFQDENENENEVEILDLKNQKTKRKKVAPKKEKEIPTWEEFWEYQSNYMEEKLGLESANYKISSESKYQTWLDNEWRDGYDNPIRDWKSKARNIVPHLKEIKPNASNIPIAGRQTAETLAANLQGWKPIIGRFGN